MALFWASPTRTPPAYQRSESAVPAFRPLTVTTSVPVSENITILLSRAFLTTPKSPMQFTS